jgi:hypothetical protein
MKIPLSLKIGIAGTVLDAVTKIIAILIGVPITWHDVTGSIFYAYTFSGLDENISRSSFINTLIIGVILLVIMFVIIEVLPRYTKLGSSSPNAYQAFRVTMGFLIMTFTQSAEALFFPVPNFIPVHSYMMLMFYDNFWSVATISDYAHTLAAIAVCISAVFFIMEMSGKARSKMHEKDK